MSTGPNPAGIFDHAVDEGQRRLEQSLLELAATSFIAGVTIVFGIVALGVVDGLVEPQFGTAAHVADALTFGVGMVFPVVGRTELCNEIVFDPVAAAVARDGTWLLARSVACGRSRSAAISSVGTSSRSFSPSRACFRRSRHTRCPEPPRGSSTAPRKESSRARSSAGHS